MHDDPSFFYWGYNFNVDWKNNLWVADSSRHTIFYISKEPESWNAIFKVTGIDNVSGMRDGNIAKATFNRPESVAIYNYNHTTVLLDLHMRPIYLNNIEDELCKTQNYNTKNYTKCGYLMTEDFPYKIVDHTRVKYIPFKDLTVEDTQETANKAATGDWREVYIADAGNHCIRKLIVM